MLPTRPSSPSRLAWAGLLALAALCLAWRRLLLQGLIPVDGNVIAVTYPNWVLSQAAWHLRRLPLWNPWRNLGAPHLADPITSALYPPLWLFSAAGDFPSFLSQWIVFHTLLSAVAAGVLALRRGADAPAAAAIAALAAFNGFLMSRAAFPHHFASACWLAPVLLAVESGRVWEAGACLALQWFAGYPPFSLMTALAALTLGRANCPEGNSRTLRSLAAGAALSAVQWVPFLEFLSESTRGALLSPDSAGQFSLPPATLAKVLLLPQWRSFWPDTGGDPSMTSFYVGLPALALAGWGALRGGPAGRGLAAAGGACLLLSLGRWIPAYRWLIPLHLMRYPANWLFPASAAIAALCGLGLSRLGGGPRVRWAAAGLILGDLLLFAQEPVTAWARPEFLSDVPELAERVAALPRLCRVHHDEALMRAWARGTLETEEDYVLMRDFLAPSYTMAFGLEDTGNFQTLRPRRSDAFRARLAASPDRERLLDLAGVRLEIALRPGESRVRRGGVLARARSTSRPRVFLDAEGAVRLESYLPGRVRARVLAPAGGRLVFTETFFPGWTAEVDGVASGPEAFEDAFLSVRLTPGEHTVWFRYRPASFFLGLAGSLLAAAAWAAAARRRREGGMR